MRSFTATEVSEKLGIRIERLRDWINKFLIVPSIQKASGRGTTNLFSTHDLYRIYLFEKLLDFGISRKRAQKLSSIRFEDIDSEKNLYSIDVMRDAESGTSSEISGWLIKDLSEIEVKKNDKFFFLINLTEMKNAVDTKLND